MPRPGEMKRCYCGWQIPNIDGVMQSEPHKAGPLILQFFCPKCRSVRHTITVDLDASTPVPEHNA